MDPLEALGQHGTHPEQQGPLGRPVPRRPRAVVLAGEHHERDALVAVALGGLEDLELLATRQVPGDASLHAGHQGVAQPEVGEGAAHHHLVVASPGAEGVEVALRHPVVEEPAPGRPGGRDRAGRGDVVGGDAVAEHG